MPQCAAKQDAPRWKAADRLASLKSFAILDTEPEPAFDDIARLAAQICGTPIAVVNFIDEHRQWVRAVVGADEREALHDVSICAHAIGQHGLFVIPDTTEDPRFRDNVVIRSDPGVRFYAGAVLSTEEGLPLGTLWVVDHVPRPEGLTAGQAEALCALARAVMRELKLRQHNRALVEREKKIDAITDALPQMAWIAGPDGRHEYRNKRYYEFTGAVPGSIDNEGWNTVAHPDDLEQAWIRWSHSIQTGEPYEAEYRLRHQTGEYRWVLARAVPEYDMQGRIVRWLGTGTDIHAWKEAEQALVESEQRHRALIETSTAIVWCAAPDGSIVRGCGWQSFSGQIPEEATGHGWLDVVNPEDQGRVIATWGKAVTSGNPVGSDYRVRHSSGEYRWVHARAVPLKAPDGSVREWVGTLTDIHEQKQATEALLASEERLRLAIETTGLGIWDANLLTGSREWTPEARKVLGISPESPATRETFLDRVHPEDRKRIGSKFFAAIPESELTYKDECRIIRADNGEVRWVAVSGRTILNGDGRAVRKLGTIQDITKRKQADDALRDSEARLQLALQAARMVAWELDTQTDHITRSENSLVLLGLGSGPVEDVLERMRPEDRVRREEFLANVCVTGTSTMEFRYFVPDGRSLWLGTRAQKAGPHRVVGVTFDITDRKAAEEEIWRVANHDPLTGLPNRLLLQHRLNQALEGARQKGTSVSLLLIDLDNFKDVNDSLGHAAGDALLQETAARLSEMMRKCDTVARLGGDEFAVVVESLKVGSAIALADSIIQKIRQPFVYEGRTIVSRASIGVAAFPDHDFAAAELMKDADMALYRAKAEGRGRAVTYSATMRVAAEQRLSLLKEVREALRREEIIPFYQPKVCLSTGRMIGLEALARWQHPVKGLLTPATFGLAFDDPELAIVLSKRLIGKIVSDIRKWLTAGIDPGRVGINFSSSEFSHPSLADDVLHVLDLAKVPTRHLEIEVTEKVLLEGRSDLVAGTLEKFRTQGVQIALDDFGTGYASLTHLKQFPVNHIKIDQSFVRDLECDPEDRAIVEAVISLAKSLNLQVTAEGVETEGQLRQLREMGCHFGQGYLFARPMSASGVVEFIALPIQSPALP